MDGQAGTEATRPFVDRPMDDRVLADRVAAAAATAWNLPRPACLRRGMNALYATGDVVLRVGHATADPELAHQLAVVIAAHGVPTVSPVPGAAGRFDGVAVTAWHRLDAIAVPVDWTAIGRFVRRVHEIHPGEVPAGYPVPDPSVFPWWDFEAMLADLGPDLDEPALAAIRATVDRHSGWSQRVCRDPVLCHGDVHPGNVVATAAGPVLLDWDLLARAAAAWDHAMLVTLAERWGGDPAIYPAFAAGYGRSLADDDLTRTLGELRNVAATLMRVRAGRSDPAAAEEAERRLRFWRGDPAAPPWRAQ